MKIILMLLTLGGLTACELKQVSQQVQQQQDVCERGGPTCLNN